MDFVAVTCGIKVEVESTFLEEYSDPRQKKWVFAYRVNIKNSSTKTVQLLNRHWIITDGLGNEQEVKGPGVVGRQPVLPPGAEHSYVSGCPLPTSIGAMRGWYEMRGEDEELFDVEIPHFLLADPDSFQ